MYYPQRPYETPTSPQAYVNQQPPNQTSFDFGQSVVELFRYQTKLTHSTWQLHQQTTDTLNNITKSSSFQEYQHFINDIPIFKAKDPKSFDEWIEQIDQVALLTNKDPNKIALAKSQGSLSRTFSSFPHSMGWNKIKEQLCYNFGSVATKQYAASMLIHQQQILTETAKYAKIFRPVTQIQWLTTASGKRFGPYHYMIGKNPTSVPNAIMLALKRIMIIKTTGDPAMHVMALTS